METVKKLRVQYLFAPPGTVRPHQWLGALLLSIGYFAGVHVGMAFSLDSAISVLWPPNALLVAALLLTPIGQWWVMLLAVFPAHMLAELSGGVPVGMACLWFLSNATEGVVGAGLLLWYLRAPPRFDRVRDVAAFLVITVLTTPATTSFVDCGFVALAQWRYTNYWDIWHTRFFSNSLAELTVVPLVVFWVCSGRRFLLRSTATQHVETFSLFLAVTLVSIYAFGGDHAPHASPALVYAPVPFLIWAALRQGVAGVTAGVALVSSIAIVGLVEGHGPFTADSADRAADSLQIFLLLFASSLMLLSASLAELRSARSLAIRHKDSLGLALGAAQAGTWEWDVTNSRVTWRTTENGGENKDQSVSDMLRHIHPEDVLHVQRAMGEMIADEHAREVEFRTHNGDGAFRWISVKGGATLRVGGKPKRLNGVFIDTTERNLQLRSAQAQQEQLTHLSRVATLGQLSGAFAHELGQPLTSIIINAQAAREMARNLSAFHSEIDEALVDIVADGKRAADVIERLRALFKKGTPYRETLNVNDCIRDVLRLEHSALLMRSVSTELSLAADLQLISADRIQLAQVLLNIITNACQAMADVEQESRKLTIATFNDSKHVGIAVRDTGRGVSDTEIIFEPFYSTKRDGIGLGLPICRTIISAHGGRLWVTNNSVRGVSFNIALPVSDSSQIAPI
jgi:signal transduction histidine kinase